MAAVSNGRAAAIALAVGVSKSSASSANAPKSKRMRIVVPWGFPRVLAFSVSWRGLLGIRGTHAKSAIGARRRGLDRLRLGDQREPRRGVDPSHRHGPRRHLGAGGAVSQGAADHD